MSKPIMLTSFMDGPCSVGCPTRQLWHIDAVKRGPSTHHCEEASPTKQSKAGSVSFDLDCFAPLAMTAASSKENATRAGSGAYLGKRRPNAHLSSIPGNLRFEFP